MADWAKPTLTSTYTNFLTELSTRIDDAGKFSRSDTVTLTNPPVGTIRWNASSSKWQANTGTVAVPVWSDLAATYGISISGNAGTATTLQTARTINSVSFNGSADVLVNTNNGATFNNAGSGAASGATFNGSAAATISYNTVGAPSTTGTGASGTWGIAISGTAATVTTNANLTGHVTSVGNAAVLGSFTSLQLSTALTDETGTGAAVFATSPTFVTPVLGTIASGVGTALTGVAKLTTNSFAGAQIGTVTALTSTAAAVAINLALNNNFSHTTSENTTLSAPTNPVSGQSGVIVITQGATARTLAYNTFWKFAGGTIPSLTATVGAVDSFAYYVESAARATCQLIKDVK